MLLEITESTNRIQELLVFRLRLDIIDTKRQTLLNIPCCFLVPVFVNLFQRALLQTE